MSLKPTPKKTMLLNGEIGEPIEKVEEGQPMWNATPFLGQPERKGGKKPSKEQPKGKLWETVVMVATAIIFATIFRSLVLDPFKVPSGSMIPTLLPGDRMFAAKWPFGYSKHSFPGKIIPMKGKIFGKVPKRGEVAIFALPSQEKVFYVKRVIAIPGDTVTLVGNVVYVNGSPLKTEKVQEVTPEEYRKMSNYNGSQEISQEPPSKMYLANETSADGLVYNIINPSHSFQGSNMGIVTVPEGHCFVMGDNRENSLDSRFPEVGFIPLNNIVAKPAFVFFSSERSPISAIFHPKSIRIKRTFRSLLTKKGSPAEENTENKGSQTKDDKPLVQKTNAQKPSTVKNSIAN